MHDPLVRPRGLRRRICARPRLAAWPRVGRRCRPDFERLAPVPFSTVCLRWRPARLPGARTSRGARTLDDANARLMDAVNRTGEVFLSHTRLAGRFAIRVAIGNLRTEARHVERAWELLREAAAAVSGAVA